MPKIRMKGPEGTCSANVMGHEYDVEDGEVEVSNPEHVAVLERHGFVRTDIESSDEAEESEQEQAEEEETPAAETKDKGKKKKKKRNRG
jgi:hypothetical protein